MNATNALFALPSTGGAVNDTLRAPAWTPTRAFRRARGWTLKVIFTPSSKATSVVAMASGSKTYRNSALIESPS